SAGGLPCQQFPWLRVRANQEVPKRDIFAVLSADAAGIVATMFALNDYSTILANPDDINGMIERYHHLGAFATMHNEAHMLYQVIEHIG
ncbi:antirestriction protein, partial [Xanthomonas euvesicatoria]|uniref:antirestriction protein n=3 Tax=Xanthomonas euvesicatoria TaxID=456327 RepID=UPI000AA27986